MTIHTSFWKLIAGNGLGVFLIAGALVLGCDRARDAGQQKPGDAAEHAQHSEAEHHDQVKLSAGAIARYGIRTEAAKRRTLTPVVIVPARVSFNTEAMAHVGAVLRGRVIELKVRKGDQVSRGAELFIVESPELGEAQSEFLQRQTALSVAAPAVDLAKDAYDRARKLFDESRGISLTELQKREVDYRASQGVLQSAQSAATAAENKLHLLGMSQQAVEALARSKEIVPRYSVYAPIDGQVTEREITLGELVSPDKEALLVLADMRVLWVLADVPEARVADIAVGSPASVQVAALGSKPLHGKVSFIDPALDPATRCARVRIKVENSAGAIRPGMFAEARITAAAGESPEPVLAVPDEAVQTVEGGPAVFVPVPGEENAFARRAVTVGRPVAGWVPVLSGLNEGQEVVVAGSFILKADLGKSEAAHED